MSADDSKHIATNTVVDISDEEIHWDQDMSYGQYLKLDTLLSAQVPQSDQHDETLFIIIHQTTELWLKLCVHELSAAMDCIRRDELSPAFKMLSRISRIQAQLLQAWDVLSTMTPSDYLKFRDQLGKSSGFQSYLYRLMEYSIGNKNAALIEVHTAHPEIYAKLEGALNSPSLYDEVLILLSKRGFDVPKSHVERDWSQPYAPSEGVEDAWLQVYREPDLHWELYELAEKLVDLEHHFQQWRFGHLKTVERIIGGKRGTGGSSGVAYLARALDISFFPELWSVRTRL